MNTEQTPSNDEDFVMGLKAQEKVSRWILSVNSLVKVYFYYFMIHNKKLYMSRLNICKELYHWL